MLVYRLERENGDGPFHTSSRIRDYIIPHNEPCEMLCDMVDEEDARRCLDAGWIFGWYNEDLMDRYITNRIEVMLDGYSISVYDLKYYLVFPDRQVIFEKETATLIERRNVYTGEKI